MRYLACLIIIPVAIVVWSAWKEHGFEEKLDGIAREIAGRDDISVDCQGFLRALIDTQSRNGEVLFDPDGRPEPKILLTRSTCTQLSKFRRHSHHSELDCLAGLDWGSAVPLLPGSPCYAKSSDTIYAVMTLAHESYHTRGVRDEVMANCDAIQTMAWVAHQLGGDESEAELIARAMEALEPMQDSDYATNECHAGLALDLHPETPDFPTEHPLAPPLAGSSD